MKILLNKVSLNSSDGDGSLKSCKEDILEEFLLGGFYYDKGLPYDYNCPFRYP